MRLGSLPQTRPGEISRRRSRAQRTQSSLTDLDDCMTEPTAISETGQVASVCQTKSRRMWLAFVVAGMVVAGVVIAVRLVQDNGPEGHYRRGRAALSAIDREAVLREVETLSQIAGYEHHAWLLQGLLYTRLGKLDEAIVYLGKAAEQPDLFVEANTAAAQCLYTSGLYLQAIAASEAALKQDDNCLDARRWLAAALYDLGALPNAVEELKRISANAPNDPRPDRLLGLIAKDGEHFADAVKFYLESLRRDSKQPDLGTIQSELAECQIRLGEFASALETLKNAEKTAAVATIKAEGFSGLGKSDDAHESLDDALRLDPDYFPAKLAKGKLLLDEGDVENAVSVLESAVKRDPASSQGHFQLSQALRQTGNNDRADAELQRMRETQAIERQFTDLHESAADHPNDPEIRFRTGELARQLGKLKLAKIWFRAALAVDPKYTKARLAIDELDALPSKS